MNQIYSLKLHEYFPEIVIVNLSIKQYSKNQNATDLYIIINV